MHAGLRARPLVPLALAMAMVLTLFAAPVEAAVPPTLKLFVANSALTLERNSRGFVSFDPGAWVTPVGGDFELWLSRPDYQTPMAFTQVDAETRNVLRTLPIEMVAPGASGLSDFATYEIVSGRGEPVRSETFDFCPNAYFRQRVSDDSPLNPRYPYSCGGGPYVKGQVWGMNEGWASGLLSDYYGLGFRAERKHYTMTFSIDPAWVNLLEIPSADASAEIDITVVDRGGLDQPAATSGAAIDRPSAPVPDVTTPDPSTLPDLVALPGFGMETYARKGRDYLSFASTEWNEGPGTFVIEGFRGQDDDTMDGFQYFIRDDGLPTGRALIGELEFHRGGGHNHWHFEEFTRYSLLDAASTEVVASGKQSWCLVNTDAIDLTVPNANWLGFGQDLGTSCGGPGALWIREVLDVGWGDTYYQSVRGQAFNITGLPNGTYFVRVHVNPTGSIFESDTANNVEDRLIKLKGRPGHRRVVVPPWHGIDTENWCYFC
jgi:hypothetical protein